MARRYKPVEITPQVGGRLLPSLASDTVDIINYTAKRDFRRELDLEVRREGYDYYWPVKTDPFEDDPGEQPFPLEDDDQGPINLVHLARRPNGDTALIVATPTRIYRYIGGDNLSVYEDGVYVDGVFEENGGQWMVIGRGFSEDGHRWEAFNLNGWSIFNNGQDIPVTYRLEETEVKPIYELREEGVIRVGTICEYLGFLFCGDIEEIGGEALEDLFDRSGIVRARETLGSQSGTTVTAASPFFTSDHVGMLVHFQDGTRSKIESYTSETEVEVADDHGEVELQAFALLMEVTQTGSLMSGDALMTQTTTSQSVTSSEAFFDVSMVGKYLRHANGWTSRILGVLSPTSALLADAASEDFIDSPVSILSTPSSQSGSADYLVESSTPFFDESMVGLEMVWDDGDTRLILEVVSSTVARVDSDSPHPAGAAGVENPDSYADYTGRTDRVSYRVLWSGIVDQPRVFEAKGEASGEAGSPLVTLGRSMASIEAGQRVAVIGGGTSGGTLIAEVLSVAGGQYLFLDTLLATGGNDLQVQHADSIGSITSYEDLGDSDGTAVLRLLPLRGTLVIYKDGSIYLGSFTGQSEQPFLFARREIPSDASLVYPWSLIGAGNDKHIYAGTRSFFVFDLVHQTPYLAPDSEPCAGLMFNQITQSQADDVFAADNHLTREIMFQFPVEDCDSEDFGLCFDYQQNTWSTTSMSITAALTPKQPRDFGPNWFLMAKDSAVLVYGKATEPLWEDGATEIYYRRGEYPLDLECGEYQSMIESGLGHFGNRHSEKDIRSVVPHFSGETVSVAVRGCRNPSETAEDLMADVVDQAHTLIPVFFRDNLFGWRVSTLGMRQCKWSGITLEASGVASASFTRREPAP
jgi:hypothetical protein